MGEMEKIRIKMENKSKIKMMSHNHKQLGSDNKAMALGASSRLQTLLDWESVRATGRVNGDGASRGHDTSDGVGLRGKRYRQRVVTDYKTGRYRGQSRGSGRRGWGTGHRCRLTGDILRAYLLLERGGDSEALPVERTQAEVGVSCVRKAV